LKRYRAKAARITREQVRAVKERDKACRRCKKLGTDIDHIIPVHRGGQTELSNLQLLCRPCHHQKSRQDRKEVAMEVSQTSDQLMLFAEASRNCAKISALPGKVSALQASAADYGESTPELLAKYDPATSLWKTSQLCLDGGLQTFSETWPRSGMMRNGIAYRLAPLVRLTGETASGLWPTPHSNMSTGAGTQGRNGGMNLQTAIGGSLNPTWVEWLMGYPIGWTALKHWATPSSRKSRKSSERQS
jgi:hypothetical protein